MRLQIELARYRQSKKAERLGDPVKVNVAGAVDLGDQAFEQLGRNLAEHLGSHNVKDDRAHGKGDGGKHGNLVLADIAEQLPHGALKVLGLFRRDPCRPYGPWDHADGWAWESESWSRLPLALASFHDGCNFFLGKPQLLGGKLRLCDLRYAGQLRSSLVRAGAHYVAVVEHDDLVGVHDGRDALGHDHERGVGDVFGQLFAQARVGLVVEGAKRVIEHHDLGLLGQRAGDGQTLALTARNIGAALADGESYPSSRSAIKSSAWATRAAWRISSSLTMSPANLRLLSTVPENRRPCCGI